MKKPDANKNWIDEAYAVDTARRGIADYDMDKEPAVAFAMSNGHPGTPLLVHRLDDPPHAYYLIPWLVTEGVAFVVKVAASDGAMLGVTTFPKPIPSPFLTPSEAIDFAARKYPRHSLGNPQLIWQPCRESTSPIRPFYKIPLGESALFVDMDGSVFSELTPLGLGGGICS